MIGPHEGKELELMLCGKKRLSVFHDIAPANGTISEDIIPDQKFFPHIQSNKIIRRQEDIWSEKHHHFIRYVLFTLPNETWRADAYLDLIKDLHARKIKHHQNNDIFLGMLLDYSQDDISDFLEHQSNFIPA